LADKKKNKEAIKSKPVKQVAVKKRSDTLIACICVAAIALITYFVFSPSLNDGFTNWDDNFYVTQNPLVINNSVPVATIFKTPVDLNYHPLTVLSLALNYQNGKLDPSGYHLENLILHLLNTILVFLFIYLLTRRNLLMAAIVSLFFGIHPMHVESVTWVSERKDVLYVFFFLSGLIAYLRYSETKKIAWYFFTLLLFILSCLSKGMAVVFPVILLLVDYLKGVKWKWRILLEKIPFFILSIVFGIIAVKSQAGQAMVSIQSFNFLQQILFASYAALMYIVKLFVPYKLSAFYPYPDTFSPNGIPLIFYLSPFIVLVLLAAVVYFFLKKEKEIVFGLLFYFVSVALVLQFVAVGAAIIADRYSYLSYIGLLFIAAYLINKVWQNKSRVLALMKYPVMLIVIIGAVTFSFQTYSRTQVWKDSDTLWSDVVNNYTEVPTAYFNRANYYYDINQIDKAVSDYTSALQSGHIDNDSYKKIYYDRGLLYYTYYKKYDLSIADYTKAIAIDDTFRRGYYNRGLVYTEVGKYDSAIVDFGTAIKLYPGYVDAYSNRGAAYFKEGKVNLALDDYNTAIALAPANAAIYNNQGSAYLNSGKTGLALADYNRAIALNPSSVMFYYNRGLCYNALNQYENAANDFTKAIQLDPQNEAAYYNMRGICNINLKNYAEAIADFSKDIDINPSVAGYWFNRSVAETKSGQSEAAKADALKSKELQVPHP
jgi:protein O-mannosyl-transferase